MDFKKPFKKNNSYRTGKVRVRKSYYTFSREYPAGNIPLERKIHRKLKSETTRSYLLAAAVIAIVAISFFTVRLSLDISYKAPEVSTTVPEKDNVTNGNIASSVFGENNFRALYMPSERLGDREYIKAFVRKIKRYNCNSVIIDFKTQKGKLNFSSLNNYAITGKCNVYDNNTVREALSFFKDENITVTARIYCFLDGSVPVALPELAVKYMDTTVNWIDTSDGGEGKTWLNPCSKEALLYLLDICKELNDLGIKGFILEKCHYPDEGNISGASYPGEKAFKTKINALNIFTEKLDEVLSKDSFVIISQTATDALQGNKSIYYGSAASLTCDGIAAYTKQRPEEITVDKKSDYVSALGMLDDISKNYKKKALIPIIDFEEYTRKYIRKIQKNSYTSFIIYDESGEY